MIVTLGRYGTFWWGLEKLAYIMHFSLQSGCTALIRASDGGHVECAKQLLDRGAEVNMQTSVSEIFILVV